MVLIGLAFLLPRYLPVKLSDRGIYSFMLAFGNVGFIGYPIVASIFGASAVFYASILNFPSTLLIYQCGVGGHARSFVRHPVQKGEVIMAEGTFLTTLLSVLSIPLLTMFL